MHSASSVLCVHTPGYDVASFTLRVFHVPSLACFRRNWAMWLTARLVPNKVLTRDFARGFARLTDPVSDALSVPLATSGGSL